MPCKAEDGHTNTRVRLIRFNVTGTITQYHKSSGSLPRPMWLPGPTSPMEGVNGFLPRTQPPYEATEKFRVYW
ncbi:hypothetical protein E2C01_069106 [Portunus trituberculatus]|uniref:Uncharacterized protein n=1 Tax=Portunus trituberculatus TaxID=210409 RepID=A0A5B7HTR4_PORTR|nr:hypothetical protein [Portunus trituberculatus]